MSCQPLFVHCIFHIVCLYFFIVWLLVTSFISPIVNHVELWVRMDDNHFYTSFVCFFVGVFVSIVICITLSLCVNLVFVCGCVYIWLLLYQIPSLWPSYLFVTIWKSNIHLSTRSNNLSKTIRHFLVSWVKYQAYNLLPAVLTNFENILYKIPQGYVLSALCH